MAQNNLEHPSDDALELYSLGRLGEPDLAQLEEHLLICPDCQDRLSETDLYVQTMREAVAEYRRRRPRPSPRSVRTGSGLWGFPQLKPVWLVAVVGLMLLVAWRAQVQRRAAVVGPAPVAVVLQALRSLDSTAAPAATPLRLFLDVQGLPSLSEWRIEIVGTDGRQAGAFEGRAREGRLEVVLPRGLPAGQYWVRVSAPESPGEILREYGLLAR
jgi:hypothetical protein